MPHGFPDHQSPLFRIRQGTRPLLISMPHLVTHVPPALAARFNDEAQRLLDTGGHLINPVDGSFGGITASRLAKMDSDGGLVGDTVGQVFSSCGIWKSRA